MTEHMELASIREQNKHLRIAVQRLLDETPEWHNCSCGAPTCLACERFECDGHDALDCARQEADVLLGRIEKGLPLLVARGSEFERLLAEFTHKE